MKHQPTISPTGSQALVTDIFGKLSREELLTALSLMHQILDADRQGDVERIITALSKRRRNADNPKPTALTAQTGRSVAETPPMQKYSHRVVRYFFSCLTKMHTKLDAEPNHPHMPSDTRRLSPRELTVLVWMKEGKTNWEIAQILGLSERTVRFHVGGIFEKLDVTSRTQAVAQALGAGLIAS